MSLQDWAANGWLRPYTTSPQEIANLLAIVDVISLTPLKVFLQTGGLASLTMQPSNSAQYSFTPPAIGRKDLFSITGRFRPYRLSLAANAKKTPTIWRHVARRGILLNMTWWVALQMKMPKN